MDMNIYNLISINFFILEKKKKNKSNELTKENDLSFKLFNELLNLVFSLV